MKKIFSIFFMLFLISFSATNLYAGAKSDGTDKGNAEAIVNSGGEDSVTKSIMDKMKEMKDKINGSKGIGHSTKEKLCTAREAMLTSGSGIAKGFQPLVYVIMSLLVIFGVKKLFIDNPDQQPNGISSNIVKGSLYFFFAIILSQFPAFLEWWDKQLVPEFVSLCQSGKKDALQITILSNLLYFVFIIVKFVGVLIIFSGMVEMVKKDRGGSVNFSGIMMKLVGGMLLVNYRLVLSWFDIIDL